MASRVGVERKKKVVLLHRSGLHRIVGEFDESVHTVRDTIQFQMVHDGEIVPIFATLHETQPHYVIYKQAEMPRAWAKFVRPFQRNR